MGLIRKTLAVGKFAIGVPPGVGPKFYSNGEAIRRQANQQTRILRQMADQSQDTQFYEEVPIANTRQERACPACAESILIEAILCRFCHSSVTPVLIPKVAAPRPTVATPKPIEIKMTSCPHCSTQIATTAKICKNCRADL